MGFLSDTLGKIVDTAQYASGGHESNTAQEIYDYQHSKSSDPFLRNVLMLGLGSGIVGGAVGLRQIKKKYLPRLKPESLARTNPGKFFEYFDPAMQEALLTASRGDPKQYASILKRWAPSGIKVKYEPPADTVPEKLAKYWRDLPDWVKKYAVPAAGLYAAYKLLTRSSSSDSSPRIQVTKI